MSLTAYACPRCATALEARQEGGRRTLGCPGCGGSAVTVPVLRHTSAPAAFKAFWTRVMQASGPGSLPCPTCRRAMDQVAVPVDALVVQVDRCHGCQLVWFDPDERRRVLGAVGDRDAANRSAEAARLAALSPEARQAIAGLEARRAVAAAEHEARMKAAETLRRPVTPVNRRFLTAEALVDLLHWLG